jgi:hypothetical protein
MNVNEFAAMETFHAALNRMRMLDYETLLLKYRDLRKACGYQLID